MRSDTGRHARLGSQLLARLCRGRLPDGRLQRAYKPGALAAHAGICAGCAYQRSLPGPSSAAPSSPPRSSWLGDSAPISTFVDHQKSHVTSPSHEHQMRAGRVALAAICIFCKDLPRKRPFRSKAVARIGSTTPNPIEEPRQCASGWCLRLQIYLAIGGPASERDGRSNEARPESAHPTRLRYVSNLVPPRQPPRAHAVGRHTIANHPIY